MNEGYVKNVIEAALLAAGRPLRPGDFGPLFDEAERPAAPAIRAALDELVAEYAERGIEIKETASGLRVQVRSELAREVSRLWPERPQRYSRALLETLALIAYRQPITRAEIEAVRGVAVNPNIIKTLLEREWVRVAGHRDVPGRPELLGTTSGFLDYFGLKSLDELPPLAELRALGEVNVQLDLQTGDPEAGAAEGAPASADAAQPPEEPSSTQVEEPAESGEAAGAADAPAAEGGAGDLDANPDDDSDEEERSASPRGSAELVAVSRDPEAAGDGTPSYQAPRYPLHCKD